MPEDEHTESKDTEEHESVQQEEQHQDGEEQAEIDIELAGIFKQLEERINEINTGIADLAGRLTAVEGGEHSGGGGITEHVSEPEPEPAHWWFRKLW